MMVGFEGTDVDPALRAFCDQGAPCGTILFGRNVVSTTQVAALIRDLRALWPRGGPAPLVAVDQEGGPVRRLRPPACPEVAALPAAATFAAANDRARSHLAGRVTGAQLAALGFNLNFAPVLDVHTEPRNPIIGERAFGTTPEQVVTHALAWAEGQTREGVLCCGKHFPGHGDTATDSHLTLPRLPHGEERLRAVELVPFRHAAQAAMPALMSAHIVYEALDPILPATLSPEVLPRLLRGDLAFDGVVFSDDLEMAAIAEHHDPEAIAAGGLSAGIDVFLVCRDLALAAQVRDALAHLAQGSTEHRRALHRAAARVAGLREKAQDHAGTPWSGSLPLQEEADTLLRTLERSPPSGA